MASKSQEDIEKGNITDIPDFTNTEDYKTKWMNLHYRIGNWLCLLIVVSFLILTLTNYKEVPAYLVGLVGSIIGYYIARAPYDLR